MKQRVVIVTGGGSGMGRAIVERFATNGDIVYAMGRRLQPLETLAQKYPKNVRAQQLDITSPESIREAIEVIYKKAKGLDVLVNCAGSAGHIEADQPLQTALTQWNQVIATNLTGAFLMTYACIPLIRKPGGRIITVTSLAAFAGSSRPGGEAYAAAKSGLHGMTRTLVRSLGPKGVTVNCVSPGVVEDTEFFGGRPISDEQAALFVPFIPAGRLGNPSDVAGAVYYLASDEAAFVNGDILHVNGGQQFGR